MPAAGTERFSSIGKDLNRFLCWAQSASCKEQRKSGLAGLDKNQVLPAVHAEQLCVWRTDILPCGAAWYVELLQKKKKKLNYCKLLCPITLHWYPEEWHSRNFASDPACYRIELFQTTGGLIWKAPQSNMFHGAGFLLCWKAEEQHLAVTDLWFTKNEVAQSQKLRLESGDSTLEGSIRDIILLTQENCHYILLHY